MTSRERVIGCCERKGYDRIPVKHEGTPEVNEALRSRFGLENDEQLRVVLGDDFRYAEPRYIGPEPKSFPDGSVEGYWGERYGWASFGSGKYLEAVYLPFAGILEMKDLDRSRYPSADWFDYSQAGEKAARLRENGFAVCCGGAGNMDFINGISRARGMEQVLMDLADDNPVFLDIMEARFRFYYDMHERILHAAGGLVDFAHVGEDLGNQIGPMIGMDIFEKHFAPKYGAYFAMVHRYGCRTLMHMCGTVWPFLERLVELGLDVYDVVQPTTPENDIGSLAVEYGDRLIFQGSMDVQKELAFGSETDVIREVQRRLRLFPDGGLIFGPSHAIQPGSPLENVIVMYREAGSLMESIPPGVHDITDATGISLAKLF